MIETGNDREIGNGNDRERENRERGKPGTRMTGNGNDETGKFGFGACLMTTTKEFFSVNNT